VKATAEKVKNLVSKYQQINYFNELIEVKKGQKLYTEYR
jgi:hypothetical protein